MKDPIGAFDVIKDNYLRYIKTAFRTKFDSVEHEREELLNKDRVLYREPWIEILPEYLTSEFTAESLSPDDLPGLNNDQTNKFKGLVTRGLAPSNIKLYDHQIKMLKAALNKKNCIITSGTGSGKTESFLLPLFAQISKELSAWPVVKQENPKSKNWWSEASGREIVNEKNGFILHEQVQQRHHETRLAAMRALILYPMNALVEDQMSRLRLALDSESVRKWLKEECGGNRIYFGRYNGATPVPGKLSKLNDNGQRIINPSKIESLKRELSNIQRNADRVEKFIEQEKEAGREVDADTLRAFFPRLDGAEMRCRFDMQVAAPDIMITNFSMLSIMLMRDIDSRIFEQTRKWLACEDIEPDRVEEEKKNRIFHLIIDELHLYRGTPGTEISYLLKLLLYRLGLHPKHPQLRILASSASLDPDKSDSLIYVGDFFGFNGADDVKNHFEIIPGKYKDVQEVSAGKMLLPTEPFIEIAKAFDNNKSIKDSAFTQACSVASEQLNRQFNITAEKTNGIEDLLRSITNPSLQLRERLHKAGKVNGSYRALCTFSKNGDENLSLPYFFEGVFGTVHSPDKIRNAGRGLLIARELLSMEGIEPAIKSVSLPRFRFHYFMRNIEGLWASLNITASDDGRTVGELLSTAQIGTRDGYRVLELLYCDNCGTLLLGGSRGKSKDEHAYEMLPVTPNIEGIPEKTTAKLVEKRTYQEYMVFWPKGGQEHIPHNLNDDSWDQRKLPGVVIQNDDYDACWKPASLNKYSGQVRLGYKDAERDTKAWIKGLLFRIVESKSGRDAAELNDTHRALPCVCPACGINEEKRKNKFTPIRGFRTGFSKTTQILAKELMYQLPESNSQRKLVVFSDSREDAAQIANGIERNHYNDLLREIVVREMHNNVLVKSKIASALKEGEGSSLKDSYPELYKDVEAIWLDATDPRAKFNEKIKIRTEEAVAELSSLERRLLSVESLIAVSATKECAPLIAEMIKIGANPAGLDIAFQKNQDTGDSWEKFFDFELKKWKNTASSFNEKITSEVLSNLATLFFGNLFYSLEASGLGYLTVNQNDQAVAVEANKLGISASELTDVLSASIRIMGHKYYFWPIDIDYDKQPLDLNKDTPRPSALKKYLNSYCERRGLELKGVWGAVREILTGQGILRENGIQLMKLFIKVADESDPVWISERGKRIHLHRAGGICTQYPESTKLTEQAQSICGQIWKQNFLSYHAAIEKRKPIRLHCEELTGQTDDQYTRQRHFRNVILQDEGEKRVKQIDLLSVTTTLEVGVDIGSLQAVMLANMPPQRFNYQQRVGRAGRRGQSYSVVLTFCRGRSHDDHYFSYPEKITGDPPPTPFLTPGQVRILKRLIAKEILRQAFKEILPLIHDQANDIHSVHGDFGEIGEWSTYRPEMVKWITNHRDTIKDVIVALKPGINEDELNDLIKWVTDHTMPGSFVEKIDTVIVNPEISSQEISEKLAEGGILPMFGMPTSQKDLYHEIIHHSEYEVNAIDRDSSLAIYEFAPGAQKTKDKAIHTAIGFTTELIPRNSGFSIGVDNKEGSPFYNERWMVQCKSCGSIHTEKDNPGSVLCTDCNVPSHVYCIKSPVAYRTDYSCGEDSKENVDILLSRPPIFVETNSDSNTEPFPKNNFKATISDQDVTWRVNTNGDNLFEGRLYVTSNAFPFNPGHYFSFKNQWILESKAQNSDGNGYRFNIKPATDKVEAIALAVNKKTEVFRLHSLTVNPALNLDMHAGFKIGVSGVRAAYFSAAFLLQRVLADKLDVDPTEIEIADIRRVSKMNFAEIVLTDELPNGSGFVRRLFNKIEEIINECTTEQRGDSYLAAIHSDIHVKECRDACYDCLKGFRNMNYHGLLDWKLATSLLRSMNNSKYTAGADGNFKEFFEIKNWLNEANQLAVSFQNSFAGMKVINGNQQLPIITNQDQSKFLIVIHPMWNCFENRENSTLNYPQGTWLGDQISKVIDMARGDHKKVRFIDTFNLHRRLGWCYQMVFNNFTS